MSLASKITVFIIFYGYLNPSVYVCIEGKKMYDCVYMYSMFVIKKGLYCVYGDLGIWMEKLVEWRWEWNMKQDICVQYCSCWWEPHAAVGVRKDH